MYISGTMNQRIKFIKGYIYIKIQQQQQQQQQKSGEKKEEKEKKEEEKQRGPAPAENDQFHRLMASVSRDTVQLQCT